MCEKNDVPSQKNHKDVWDILNIIATVAIAGMVGFGGYIINDKQNQLDDRIRSQELELEQRKQKFEESFQTAQTIFEQKYKERLADYDQRFKERQILLNETDSKFKKALETYNIELQIQKTAADRKNKDEEPKIG